MTRARDLAAFVSNADGDIKFDTDTLFIDSSANRVGIGETAPERVLHIKSADNIIGLIESTDADAWLAFQDDTSASNNAVRVGATGDNLRFYAGSAERVRIDSSGNLLVGKTSIGLSTTGIDLRSTGLLQAIRNGGTVVELNRQTSDGTIIDFRKDGTAVGGISARSGDLLIGTGDVGLRFDDGADAYIPFNFATSAGRDNAIDVGASSARFDDIYATNGTIQTSDEREKQQIASLTSAEITAATAISKLFKTFKWNDSVAENGENARTHTGVIAQQVEQAMTDAGLTASNYAFWCSDTWWENDVEVAAVEADEENGIEAKDAYTRTDTYDTQEEAPEGATERNRKGIRYPELLSFIGAATEQRLTSIEARLDALEAG